MTHSRSQDDKEMKRWVMIYASTRQPDGSKGTYVLRLQTSKRPDGGFRDYSCATNVNSTGVTSSMVGGKRYVFSGDVQSDGHNNYPVFTYPDLKKVGRLNIDITDGGTRGWNNVTPFPEGLKKGGLPNKYYQKKMKKMILRLKNLLQ